MYLVDILIDMYKKLLKILDVKNINFNYYKVMDLG